MTGPLDRAAAFLLAPTARTAAPAPAAAVPAAARAIVLGTDEAARPLAAALALTLRGADRAPAGLVAVWRAGGAGLPPPRGLAARSAARLAGRLAGRELPAVGRGRLTWLDLPLEPPAAVTAVHRAAAIVDGPLVTVLAGPRPPELERLVEQHDLAIVAADPDGALARAALSGLEDRCVSALACRPLPRGLPRAVALAGVTAPRLDPPLSAAPTEAS
jgi:hypothetical protein